jgi:hypothetical protein
VPVLFGTSNSAGLVEEIAPNLHADSVITKFVVASGIADHPGVTVKVVALFVTILRSCPAPVPAISRAVIPEYTPAVAFKSELPMLVELKLSAITGPANSSR